MFGYASIFLDRHFAISMLARIQDSEGGGGVRTFRRGGFVQEFQERVQIVAGPWANQQAKKIADSRRGGGGVPITPQKKLYPRLQCGILPYHHHEQGAYFRMHQDTYTF